MRVAVIGAGVAGLTCAARLHPQHEVTVFEAADRLGGHTNTIDVPVEDGRVIPVDTGFIVFNPAAYPIFSGMLDELGVESAPTDMTFSVRDDRSGLEWGGRRAAGLFARKRNLVSPAFWRMLVDIRRFGARARADAAGAYADASLGEYLAASGLSEAFARDYLVPMAASIWSAPPGGIRDFPFRAIVAFFDQHGMLEPWRAPTWRYIVGGSRTYVHRLVEPFRRRIRMLAPINEVRRTDAGVRVTPDGGPTELFDEVVIAAHSDQALAMLADADPRERRILSAIRYHVSEAVVHTDDALLPRRRAAWAAWNYHTHTPPEGRDAADGPTLTYHMNILQRLDTRIPINVTLNARHRIDPAKVITAVHYAHPQFTREAIDAQQRWGDISGVRGVHFCGAYWGWGFHEDGVRSAVRVCERIGAPV